MPIYEIEAPNGKIIEIEGDTPPTEAEIDTIFSDLGFSQNNKFTLDVNELDKRYRKAYSEKLNKRQEWEQKHPVISRLQADFQPNYRADVADWQTRAKYGLNVPFMETIKTDLKKTGLNLVPAINTGLAIATSGTSAPKSFIPAVLKGAGEAALENSVAEGLDEIANNGLSLNAIKRPLQGGTSGGIVGALSSSAVPGSRFFAQKFTGLKPEIYERLISPNSKALSMTQEQAERLAYDTTERFRNAYENLKNKYSRKVGEEAKKLVDNETQVPLSELQNDIKNVYDSYSTGRVNSARANTGELENELYQQINNIPGVQDTITPYELVGLRRQIGDQINWDNADIRNKNDILSKVYGKFNKRLDEISPSLTAANKEYASLANLLDEKSRLRTILNPKVDLETATTKLKNYKVVNDNIYDLEKKLVAEGNAPFLSEIDDINAAIELEKSLPTGRNIGGVQDIIKGQFRPVLEIMQKANRKLPKLGETTNMVRRKIVNPILNRNATPLLYGGVSNTNNDEDYYLYP